MAKKNENQIASDIISFKKELSTATESHTKIDNNQESIKLLLADFLKYSNNYNMNSITKSFSKAIEPISKMNIHQESMKNLYDAFLKYSNNSYMRNLAEILNKFTIADIKMINYQESMNYLIESFSKISDFQKNISESLFRSGYKDIFIKMSQRLIEINESNFKTSNIYDQILKLNTIMGYYSNSYSKIVKLFNSSIFNEDSLDSIRNMNTFNLTNKYAAFLYRKDRQYDRNEVIEYIEEALPTQIREKGMIIINKIEVINDLFQNSGVDAPFKISTKTISAVRDIVGVAATSKDNLSKVITALYILIYDGTGELKRIKNMISSVFLEKLLIIKFLRHSKEHNQEIQSNSSKLLVRVGDIYIRLCDKHSPISEKDFLNVQNNLYKEIIEVFDSAIDHISRLNTEELLQILVGV
jgi:hypothetical protein